jgi:tetraacyldisaccharide 4'-kinase
MRAPSFWWREKPSLRSLLLLPTSLVYGMVAGRRMKRRGETAALPVICIGNFTAGGAGKTPTAVAVAELLAGSGEIPAFLTRGYGGSEPGPLQVDRRHTAREVGDEPLLLAAIAPVIVSRDRPAGTRLALESGATAIVMDDGLQNPSLVKDCAIAVVDGATGTGNGLVIPSGPLRAPMSAQWDAIDAVIIIGKGIAGEGVAHEAERRGKKVFAGRLVPDGRSVEALKEAGILAFAGIGRPEKFFETLREAGIDVVEARRFPDHHAYSAEDIAHLKRVAEDRNLIPVTTEKDLARLAIPDGKPIWPALKALPVRLRVDDSEGLRNLLLRRIAERRTRAGSA